MPGIEKITDVNMGLVWVALLVLLILYKALDIFATKWVERWDHRKGNGLQGSIKSLQRAMESLETKVAGNPPYPQCHYVPDHFDQIRETREMVGEIHTMQETQKLQIAGGKFGCKVKEDHLRKIEQL